MPRTRRVLVLVLPRMELLLRLVRLMVVVVVMLLMMVIRLVHFRTVDGLLAMQCQALKALVRLLERLLCALHRFVHEKRETLRPPGLPIEPQRTFLNFPELPEEFEQLSRIDLRGHIADENLPQSVLGNRRRHRGRRGDRPGRGKLGRSNPIPDLLLRLLQRLPSPAPALEEDESVALRLPGDPIGNRLAILDLSILHELRN